MKLCLLLGVCSLASPIALRKASVDIHLDRFVVWRWSRRLKVDLAPWLVLTDYLAGYCTPGRDGRAESRKTCV